VLDLARYLGVANFFLRRPSHTVSDLVAAADVVVDTADTAAHRAAVIAALSAATPVVGTDVDGLSELLVATGAAGAAVDSIGDPEALAAATRRQLGRTVARPSADAESAVDSAREEGRTAIRRCVAALSEV
jgi:glycosyltransferase involved in cell wall biosynthesis